MKMTTRFRQALKAKAHALKPLITIGANGLTENIKKDTHRLLTDHELIKVRINETDRVARKALFIAFCEAVSADAIQLIGGIGVVYRQKEAE